MPKEPLSFVDLQDMQSQIQERIYELMDVKRDIEKVMDRGIRYTEIKYLKELDRLKAGCKRLAKSVDALESRTPVYKQNVDELWGKLWEFWKDAEGSSRAREALTKSDVTTWATIFSYLMKSTGELADLTVDHHKFNEMVTEFKERTRYLEKMGDDVSDEDKAKHNKWVDDYQYLWTWFKATDLGGWAEDANQLLNDIPVTTVTPPPDVVITPEPAKLSVTMGDPTVTITQPIIPWDARPSLARLKENRIQRENEPWQNVHNLRYQAVRSHMKHARKGSRDVSINGEYDTIHDLVAEDIGGISWRRNGKKIADRLRENGIFAIWQLVTVVVEVDGEQKVFYQNMRDLKRLGATMIDHLRSVLAHYGICMDEGSSFTHPDGDDVWHFMFAKPYADGIQFVPPILDGEERYLGEFSHVHDELREWKVADVGTVNKMVGDHWRDEFQAKYMD